MQLPGVAYKGPQQATHAQQQRACHGQHDVLQALEPGVDLRVPFYTNGFVAVEPGFCFRHDLLVMNVDGARNKRVSTVDRKLNPV